MWATDLTTACRNPLRRIINGDERGCDAQQETRCHRSGGLIREYGNDPVRRLTPMECERLQGFPDGWTDIPYRGKPYSPDSARYKALGNSMAVPVMRWIGRRIEKVES